MEALCLGTSVGQCLKLRRAFERGTRLLLVGVPRAMPPKKTKGKGDPEADKGLKKPKKERGVADQADAAAGSPPREPEVSRSSSNSSSSSSSSSSFSSSSSSKSFPIDG